MAKKFLRTLLVVFGVLYGTATQGAVGSCQCTKADTKVGTVSLTIWYMTYKGNPIFGPYGLEEECLQTLNKGSTESDCFIWDLGPDFRG